MKSVVLFIFVALLMLLPSCAESAGSERGREAADSLRELDRSLERQSHLTLDLKGDVDCDSDVDAVDALKVQQYVAGLSVIQSEPCPDIGSPGATTFGDVDCDGDVDAVDSLGILRDIAGLLLLTAQPDCPIADGTAFDNTGPHLRGANIFLRPGYPELDGLEFLGADAVGPPHTQADFDALAALGANYVNISHPGLFTEVPPYMVDQDNQESLDRLLDMITEADMFAVISFRTGPGRSAFSLFVEDPNDPDFQGLLNDSMWQDEEAQDAWSEMWRHTAERYRENPIVVGYDLMVEPNSNDVGSDMLDPLEIWEPDDFYANHGGSLFDWNHLYPELIDGIREVDPATPILVGAMSYSAIDWLPFLVPTDDSRTIYAVHQYAPFEYTHQVPPLAFAYPGEFDTDGDGSSDQFDRAWLDDLFAIVDTFRATHGVPVAANEFGVIRWEPGAAAFMDDQMDLLEQRGMNHALWNWDPSWEPYAAEVNEFNFRFGPDPANHTDRIGQPSDPGPGWPNGTGGSLLSLALSGGNRARKPPPDLRRDSATSHMGS
jgi:hypothetical protein